MSKKVRPQELPVCDPLLCLLAYWIVASAGVMKPKARERAFQRMAVLTDSTAPKVVHIKPRALDRAFDGARTDADATWKALGPGLQRLSELGK